MLLAAGVVQASPVAITFDAATPPAERQYTLVAHNAKLVPGENEGEPGAVLVDTTASNAIWNPCFMTVDTLFAPDKQYDISFACQFEEQGQDSYILLLMRPLGARNHMQDAAFMEVYATPKNGKIHFHVSIPQVGPRYAFQLHAARKVRARISDLQIKEMVRAFLPASENTPKASLPPALPTGSAEFAVEPPKLDKAKTFNGKDFGILPENPDNTRAFQEAINAIRKQVPARLVLDPGEYRFTNDTAVVFPSVWNFELDGQGSKFVFLKNKDKLFRIEHCRNIAFRNFSIDWDWEKDPLASIVRVEAKSEAGDAMDLRFVDYVKFPKENVRVAHIQKIDPKTRFPTDIDGWNVQFEFYKGQGDIPKTSWLEPNLLRVPAAPSKISQAKVGDTLLMRHYTYDMNAINMINNKHLTFDNVHVLSCPGMGMLVSGVQEYWQVVNSSVAPPKGSKRPTASTADCMHVTSSRGHFKLENTVLGGGGDDTLNIHDSNVFAVRVDDHHLKTLNIRYLPGNYFQAGDLLELRHDDFSPTGFQAKMQSIKPVDRGRGMYEIAFEEKLPEQVGSGFVLFNRRYGTSNVIVRDCTFHLFPRGILLMANNVTIENNKFIQGRAGAIKIETGYTMKVWSEGNGASNIVIRGNQFTSANRMGRYTFENRPDIYISTYLVTDPSMAKASYPILSDILIEGNTFRGTTGAPVFMASAGRVTIRGNTFDMHGEPSVKTDYRGGIGAIHSSNIVITDNTWIAPGPTCKPGIFFDKDSVTGLHFFGNRIKP
jgi:hypothetical protein